MFRPRKAINKSEDTFIKHERVNNAIIWKYIYQQYVSLYVARTGWTGEFLVQLAGSVRKIKNRGENKSGLSAS